MAGKKRNQTLIGRSKGFVAVLLAGFVPVIMFGTNYLMKYTKKSGVDTSNFEIPYIIGINLVKSFNPGKTWTEQEDYLYSIAAQTYDDEFSNSNKKKAFAISVSAKAWCSKISPKITSLYDFYRRYSTYGRRQGGEKFADSDPMLANHSPIENFIYNEASNSGTYSKYSSASGESVAYSVNKYSKDTKKLQISLNNSGSIKVTCKELKREATVNFPKNDIDIVIAIPTNRASNTMENDNTKSFGTYTSENNVTKTPIKQISRACQSFLKYFLHTPGVAVGIVPYSGKVTMSPYSNYLNYTTSISMSAANPNLTYVMQSMFYGSDGKLGGDISLHGSGSYGDYKNWGSPTIGLPIMARRGQYQSYRGMTLNTGAMSGKTGKDSLLLDMKTSPTAGDNYKFMQMNTNPCYLGFCNTLAMTCEKDCPTYMANPYFMTELTSDIQSLIYDLELFVPFKDEKNKSNFLFLPLVMAGNMFSWGSHPSELSKTGRITEVSRDKKTRVVIIIANAPDNFEPQEMTYLGFNNDYSEIPMIESDTIIFNQDRGYQKDGKNYKGAKGIVYFSPNGGSIDSTGYVFKGDSTARISFPNKGLLKVVAERYEPATVTVYNANGVQDNVGSSTFLGNKTLKFSGPQQVYNYSDLGTKFQSGYYTTKGKNFGHNLSTKKVKVKFSGCKLSRATLSNQILRYYGAYSAENGQSLIQNTSGSVWSGGPAAMRQRMDPNIDASANYNNSTNGWLFNSSNYLINAYAFNPKCYGVTRLKSFVMAPSNFISDTVEDNAKINTSTTLGSVKYDTSSGTKYRSYTNAYSYPSAYSDYIQVLTGNFNIKSYYYYKLFDWRRSRTRSISQSINTYRHWPATAANSSGTSSNACCSTIWTPRRVAYSCTGTCYEDYWTTCSENYWTTCPETYWTTCSETYTGTCSKYVSKTCSETYTGTCSEDYWTTCSRKTSLTCWEKYTYTSTGTCTREVPDISGCKGRPTVTCSKWKTETYSCKKENEGTRSYDCSYTTNYSCQKTRNVSCQKTRNYDCSYYQDYSCQKTRNVSCQKTRYNDCQKTRNYDCQKTRAYSCTQTCYKTVYDDTGRNNSSGCSGVSWNHYLGVPSGWSASDSGKTVSCSDHTPTTTYRRTYNTTQTQNSSSCSFSDGATGNSSCSWASISAPSVASYGYANCNGSTSSCSVGGSMDRTVSSWSSENQIEQKRFYSFYQRNPDGTTKAPTFEICNASGHSGCSSTSYSGSPTGTRDDSLTRTSPYRYNLQNFFFVNANSLATTYSYSGSTPTSNKISEEFDLNLLKNKGIYLLPVSGEANTYWICFCGDGALQLDFTEATDSSVTFSNIKDVKYNLSLESNGKVVKTAGLSKTSIDTQEIFYVHPDQIKNVDSDGNYYVDIKTTGNTRIVSVELTNRPLMSVKSSNSDIEIVGKDSSGGKVVGNSSTNVEFKLKRKSSFSFTAEPAYFWIEEGKDDFRQTSGTTRICGNSNKFSATVRATAPDGGSGKITIEADQPAVSFGTSDTDVVIKKVTPNYNYTVTSDRKLKSINVPSFVAPKAMFSGDIPSKSDNSYIFCHGEVGAVSDQKLFDWNKNSMSHSSTTVGVPLKNQSLSGTQKLLNFNLTACKLISAQVKDLNIQFGPKINDFLSVRIRNEYGDNTYKDDSKGYYVKRTNNNNFVGGETEIQLDLSSAYGIYGPGSIDVSVERTSKPASLTLFAGDSNYYWGTDKAGNTVTAAGLCNSAGAANAKMHERIESSVYEGLNYLKSVTYTVPLYDLTKRISYSTSSTSNHNYAGSMPFNGVGDIRIYVQPQKVKTSNYTRNMSEAEIESDVFGNYKYKFEITDRLLNTESKDGAMVPLYTGGKIGSTSVSQGNYKDYSVKPTNSINGYYYSDIAVENVQLSISSSSIFSVGSNVLLGQQGDHTAETFVITEDDYPFEYQSDGYYHVKVPCRNVYISNVQLTDDSILYYAHPNIITDKLKNTRIIDGYDRATNQNMKKYGNINYNNSSLPSVSPVQRLFYNKKANNNAVYVYPRVSGTGSALTGEEGDFFIQLWDHNDSIPAVRWKIGSSIQSATGDISVANSGFSAFKSNYAFSGLHRMFFPYEVYNKNYAGYSYANNSAFVFAGYTLPINLILASNGYQQTFNVDSNYVSSYTKPNTALENLAKDACARLKTDLSNSQGRPAVFLVKYRTSSTLSLESCADYKYTASDEKSLTDVLNGIAKTIRQLNQNDVLRIEVKDLK